MLNGQAVFVIYPPPPCPDNASCSADVVIDKQLYGIGDSIPKVEYRTGPLFAVGPNQEAHLIPDSSTSAYRILALRTGSDWGLAFSPGVPAADAVQRQICNTMQNLPRGSYCVTHLGLPTTDPFDPTQVPAPTGNGHGPGGTCTGTETSPPCGPGVIRGKYYPYTVAEGCDGNTFFDGNLWRLSLTPTQPQPPRNGWIVLNQPDSARWTGTNGTDSLRPAPPGPAPGCPVLPKA